MVTYPGIGEEFSRKLLQIIFQKDFGKLKVVPQKVYYGSDTRLHGARLDVYLEEEGARTIFLYTKGTKGSPPKKLRELLHYMEHTKECNAKDADLQEIHRMVEKVKLDAEVTIAYMRLMEDERILLDRGRSEGKAEGKTEGLTESILDFLGELGPVSDKLRENITAQTDVNILKVWLKNAARAESIEEFERRL